MSQPAPVPARTQGSTPSTRRGGRSRSCTRSRLRSEVNGRRVMIASRRPLLPCEVAELGHGDRTAAHGLVGEPHASRLGVVVVVGRERELVVQAVHVLAYGLFADP